MAEFGIEARGTGRTKDSILYVPGNGFVLGVDDSHRRLIDRLCDRTGAQGYLLHYRLAPEFPFPAAHQDTINAIEYVHARTSGRLWVVADSAGGALALSAIVARRADSRQPDRVVLLSPLTDLAMTGLSHVYNRYREPMFGPEALIHKDIPGA
ncbi:alpha/beta hydrolase fold domain-containing protein [Nocardia sp. NPDC049707]|uniref:alpha/beta hydrolase n=1 Tax=Nocardia sp. NPDC049707 TaxID=3154735 RepID=UPI00342C15E5